VRTCRCPPRERTRYLGRLSGPLLDRIDLFAEMSVWRGAFSAPAPAPVGAGWREVPTWEVMVAARRRLAAWSREAGAPQAAGNGAFMDEARRALGLSLRAVVRCQAVAATVAALDAAVVVEESHLREALEFRRELLIDPAG
jgi:magnesium chelatase family protein